MTPHTRKSFLFLWAASLLLAASALKAGDLDDPRYAADLRLHNSSDFLNLNSSFFLSERPVWFRNALANPRVSYFRSPSYYDRDGDRVESIRYSNDVGTLANPFNAMLLTGGSAFAYGGAKTLMSYNPDATLATDYTHIGTTSAKWSVTTDWTPTAPAGGPNGAGDIVRYQGASSITTTQDTVGGVTVGQITLQGTNPNSWTITPTTAITLNNNGSGATISNTDSSTSSSQFLMLSAGTLTLADNLLVSNTGGSTNTTGAIQLTSTIGGSGNVTFSNVNTALSQTGSIRIQTGANTFTGSVLVQKGTISFNNNNSFGNSANTITLGQSGQGSAAIVATAGTTVSNPIVVASGSGGTLTIARTGTGTSTFSGTILLNGDLTIYSETTNATGFAFTNSISGPGGIAKTGTGIAVLSGTNSYLGTTQVNAGTFLVNGNSSGATGAVSVNNSGTVLGGTGNIGGATTVNTLATITGATAGTIGTLTLSNAAGLAFTGSSIYQVDINATTSDKLVISGVLNLSGLGDTINFNSLATPTAASYTLATYTGVIGVFDIQGSVPAGYTLLYTPTELDLVMTPVPEPSTWIGAALALGVVAWTQRRKLRGSIADKA